MTVETFQNLSYFPTRPHWGWAHCGPHRPPNTTSQIPPTCKCFPNQTHPDLGGSASWSSWLFAHLARRSPRTEKEEDANQKPLTAMKLISRRITIIIIQSSSSSKSKYHRPPSILSLHRYPVPAQVPKVTVKNHSTAFTPFSCLVNHNSICIIMPWYDHNIMPRNFAKNWNFQLKIFCKLAFFSTTQGQTVPMINGNCGKDANEDYDKNTTYGCYNTWSDDEEKNKMQHVADAIHALVAEPCLISNLGMAQHVMTMIIMVMVAINSN